MSENHNDSVDSFCPESFNQNMTRAGLLTHSPVRGLPIPMYRGSGAGFEQVTKSLQQRELFRSYT